MGFPLKWEEYEKHEFGGLAKELMNNLGVTHALGCRKGEHKYLEDNMREVEQQHDLLRDKY